MMPRPDVSVERKNQIIQAAIRVFSRKGIEAARMEEIAAEAGMSIGGVYWYYKSKADVVLAILDWLLEEDRCLMETMTQGQGTVKERLLAYTDDYLEGVTQYQPVLDELYSLASHNPEINRRLQADYSSFRLALIRLIEQGLERGELKAVDPQVLALTIMALHDGMFELGLIDSEIMVKRDLHLAYELLFEGLEQKPGERPPTLHSGGAVRSDVS
jgi:AcrR family transcriptional regulator